MAGPVVRAREAGGQVWDDPSETTLHDALADLNLTWRFLIVERLDLEPAGQHYMQVFLNDDLSYQVEYREGGEDKHFQAHVPRQPVVIGVEPIAKVLADWASGGPGWREALPWEAWP
ncbi:hypothetical protein E1211_08155 [Micromonospora sp. 15K316]|uniref:hypothetical protein n=1 Tax=Micromonospora sp. 15K316 TaxID=2530376 RepID=UPI00104C77EE|nr:hypothetical protein [Micromonospora sp. 15K316]TDC38153.1 hypothetical protein E1211_08155 [Micromonospora sp. 15K316]